MPEGSLPRVVRSHDIHLDSDYADWILDVKKRFRSAQIKAAVKVNSEQLLFNWQLGRDLVERKAEETWGSGIVEQVSLDLQNEFPGIQGFSTRNLWNMKKWYLFYASAERREKLQGLVAELEEIPAVKLEQIGGTLTQEKLQRSVAEFDFPAAFAFVPWGHHIDIVSKCSSVEEAAFYIGRTIREGWSRPTLQNAMKADLFHTSGHAITNFGDILPKNQSALAQAITKDTYDLSFITLPPKFAEKDLEDALERNITNFLLELGMGFSFVGRQKEIIVSGKTRKIDMLFYHIHLRRYIVVELKVESFDPEFVGKLNFYVNAVDELIKTPNENPTLGLLICRDKDDTEVQWAFKGVNTPLGVATYENIEIKEIQEYLPSTEQIQERIAVAEQEFLMNVREQADADSWNDKGEN
ncbi:MAG: DUF1016 family protein [Butyrivibrio sp.]|nr:DUF1016 family protein [Butyrivibrio sp.]